MHFASADSSPRHRSASNGIRTGLNPFLYVPYESWYPVIGSGDATPDFPEHGEQGSLFTPIRELTSLRSSIMNYHDENGRRCHAYHVGSYCGPNDERAMDHFDLGHHLYYIILQGELYLAPIPKDPQRVLDIGTGTGIWAIDFVNFHPSAKVIGTDLSPTQPSLVPPNLHFEIDDCCDEWAYSINSFDFIHVRGLYGCVADWDKFYKQALKHLKPGGYIEQVELSVEPKSEDGSIDGAIFEKWGKVSVQAGEAFGKSLTIVGFVDVVEHRIKVLVGPWPKDPRLKELGRVENDVGDKHIRMETGRGRPVPYGDKTGSTKLKISCIPGFVEFFNYHSTVTYGRKPSGIPQPKPSEQ
ncbi:conserved hypothetical protein [Talaromyces stipitatus ATCC 10500]|uniref:S-adenosyl-L-methionine-dependent methyltransferase n=1 Tax=Talaromyces stipitatus (strain ATCC 10500 / CBS 375.48 / QM 6759 / NRRL 1006) TaxID=441959 RepID=B8MTL1_TALSN|nr:uncharacterized protein TSTA_004630 [Talaromyces stipitatus ATCC 10500]EED12417.1 conserved hypothetical protein [Talaromyces stipitatus ATCC 10500]